MRFVLIVLNIERTMNYRILPPEEILETTVELPLSKSISARELIISYVSGQGKPAKLSASADTCRLAEILDKGLCQKEINAGAGGTTFRFMAALLAATEGTDCLLCAEDRMSERPVAPLVDALRCLGADIEYAGKEGCPPLRIKGRKLKGGELETDASVSSQFVSALMMVVPLMEGGLHIKLLGEQGSVPYIKMTAAMMGAAGVDVETDPYNVWVKDMPYKVLPPMAEPDWSSAAFWYEIAAVTAGWVTLPGLKEKSLQGDSNEAILFERLGTLTEFGEEGAELSATPDLYSFLECHMADMPDAVPALAVTAALVGVPFRMTGVSSLRHKECDRLEALLAELLKIGIVAEIENYGDTLTWDGRRVPVNTLPVFDTYQDHRMAMSLAAVSVFIPGIIIKDSEVVEKSYPGFWSDLENAGFVLEAVEGLGE